MTFGCTYFARNVTLMAIRLLTSKFDFFRTALSIWLIISLTGVVFFAEQTNKHYQMSAATQYVPYKVKDMSLADWGRTEIKLAEAEMPGLMALREEYGASEPLAGARIADYIGVKVEGPFKPEHYRY